MGERDSWAVMNGATRVLDAEDSRLAVTALITPGATSVRGRQGLRPGPGNPGLVTATSPTPDINVKVEKFQAVITATRGLGEYIATLDADKTINVLGDTPAHGTQQRNHLIIAVQTDTYYGDGSTKFEVIEVIGTAGAGDPSLAAYSDYIPLARLRITAGATTVTGAMIDDLRPSWVVALGGTLPIKDQTERDALTAWNGLEVYRRDRKWIEIHDGTAWRVQGVAVCSSVADRNSAITGPYSGQLAMTTDTDTLWQYDGATSAWAMIGGTPMPRGRIAGTGPVTSNSVAFGNSAEVLLWSLGFISEGSTRDYMMKINTGWLMSAGTATFALRWVAGAGPVTSTDTLAWSFRCAPQVASGFNRLDAHDPIVTGLPAGQITIGLFGISDGPVDGQLWAAANNQRRWDIIDEGA